MIDQKDEELQVKAMKDAIMDGVDDLKRDQLVEMLKKHSVEDPEQLADQMMENEMVICQQCLHQVTVDRITNYTPKQGMHRKVCNKCLPRMVAWKKQQATKKAKRKKKRK